MTFTLMPRKIEERVPAWEECPECQGEGHFIDGVVPGNIEQIMCDDCQGSGGKWHKAVNANITTTSNGIGPHIKGFSSEYLLPTWVSITKSSFLVRKHSACVECDGDKIERGYKKIPGTDIKARMVGGGPCSHCLKDKDDKPTGAEPGTAGPWRVV